MPGWPGARTVPSRSSASAIFPRRWALRAARVHPDLPVPARRRTGLRQLPERGTSSIGIGAGGETAEDRFGYWVYVDDVDASIDAVSAAGAPAVAAPVDQPWGERVAQTRDPDGNLVYLGAAIGTTPT